VPIDRNWIAATMLSALIVVATVALARRIGRRRAD
jgi:hypothetical protein